MGGIIFLMGFYQSRGKENANNIISDYLDGISERNVRKLTQLTPSDYDSHSSIQNKLQEFGGSKFQDVTIKIYGGTVNPSFWNARVKANRLDINGNKSDYEEELNLLFNQNRWYLLLGTLNSSSPPISDSPLPLPDSED